MSAPGNSVILLVLLGLFLGCAGYALGRLHERRMSGEEREEAYRDGYDHAARSVFSLAARVAGPRRRGAVRASVVVGEGQPRTGETAPAPILDPAPASTPSPSPAPASTPSPAPAPASTPVAVPAVAPPVLGFPAPAPHVVPGLPLPAAEGGVNYSTLADPHWSGQTEPIGESPAVPVPSDPAPPFDPALPSVPGPSSESARPSDFVSRSAAGSPSDSVSSTPSVPAPRARHSAEPERAGRHTVPDELVRAATYKLAADRVARAKVRAPEEPADPPVPRPRGQ